MIRRCQAVLADERHELLRGDQERNRVNETEQPQNDEARQPVGISASMKPFEEIVARHRPGNAVGYPIENVQRSTFNFQRRNKRSARGES